MGSVPIGFDPGLLALKQRGHVSQGLRRDQAFEGRQPVLIITRPVVRYAAIGGGLEFIGKRGGPLFPGEIALLGEPDSKGECLRLQRSAKTGPPVSRGNRGNAARRSAWGMDSGWLKVVVPHLYIYRIAWRGLLAPQLTRGEAN